MTSYFIHFSPSFRVFRLPLPGADRQYMPGSALQQALQEEAIAAGWMEVSALQEPEPRGASVSVVSSYGLMMQDRTLQAVFLPAAHPHSEGQDAAQAVTGPSYG